MTDGDECIPEEVRRKAERMRRARTDSGRFWRDLAHATTLGWQVMLPVVALVLPAWWAGRRWDVPGLALLGIVAGVTIGLAHAARTVARTLDDQEDP